MTVKASQVRTIVCSHRDFQYLKREFDFGEFWHGAPEKKTSHGGAKWKGGFRGRPELADALWPTVQLELQQRKPDTIGSVRGSLRAFWRFLDGYESRVERLQCLEDVGSHHCLLWIRPIDGAWEKASDQNYLAVGRILRLARQAAGLKTPFLWHPYPRPDRINRRDPPGEEEGRALLHELKQRAREIFDRWARTDYLVQSGRNLLSLPRKVGRKGAFGAPVSEADALATFSALIVKTGNPLANFYDLAKELCSRPRKTAPTWWPGGLTLKTLRAGFFPTKEDTICLSCLFMLRCGWNPCTTYALDVSNPNWAQLHGDAESRLYYLEAFKERSGTWQDTLSPEKLSTGCYRIAASLLERTRLLREWVLRNPHDCLVPAIAVRSPWLSIANVNKSRISVLQKTGHSVPWLRHVVSEYNERRNPSKPQIRETITPSDFRDIVASFTFLDSRFSWTLTQWVLGQKRSSSTRRYLRSMAWRKRGEQQLKKLNTVIIDEIEVHRRVDATIISARVNESCEVTKAARDRLDAHRRVVSEAQLTYSGFLCRDPCNPPPSIDPSNPRDGKIPCSQGHLCAGCLQGEAFDVDRIARRVAELRWLQRNVNAVVWMESDYSVLLMRNEATLKQWPEVESQAAIKKWNEQIASGRHKVIRFGGI